jgi:hypothetical protein
MCLFNDHLYSTEGAGREPLGRAEDRECCNWAQQQAQTNLYDS